MQAAGMLRGTGAAALSVYLLGTLLLAFVGDNAHALPLQVLPNIPGYIPVYIRLGDQPLQDINPALAEAFHEKEVLENTPPEHLDEASGNSDKIAESRPLYEKEEAEDDDGLDAGSRRKDTIYLIGVRQSSSGDKSKGEEEVPKIALPFEVLEREAASAKAEDGQDRTKPEDAWIEGPGKSHGRKPIALSKQAAIKVGGLPVDVKDLEKLAAEVEKEETRPNDLYDSSSVNDRDESGHGAESHIGKVSVWRSSANEPSAGERSESSVRETNTDRDDLSEDTRPRASEDPKEFRSSRWTPSERLSRPSRDPKELRSVDDEADFMEGEE